MATIRPFQALRPPTENASAVSAVPYDVVNTEEARQLADGNPLSFLHVSRPEIDLEDSVDPYSDAVYRKAAENFETLRLKAPLTLESSPSLFEQWGCQRLGKFDFMIAIRAMQGGLCSRHGYLDVHVALCRG